MRSRGVVNGMKSAPRDEAYDAFVTMYRDNSYFKSTYDVCVSNGFLK